MERNNKMKNTDHQKRICRETILFVSYEDFKDFNSYRYDKKVTFDGAGKHGYWYKLSINDKKRWIIYKEVRDEIKLKSINL